MKKRCLVPECDHVATRRGLCHNHYQIAYTLVLKEKTTWEKLEALGKCLPSKRVVKGSKWFLDDNEETRG